MNITYTTDSPPSGTAVDTATGSPLYEINTELGSPGQSHTHSTTTIRDVRQGDSVSRGTMVAVWVHAFNRDDDCVTIHGQTRPLVEWLPETNTPSRARKLVAPDGQEYVWKQSARPKGTFELVHTNSERTVVTSHHGHPARHYGLKLFGASRSVPKYLNLDVAHEAASDQLLPAVLLSFAVLEGARREQALANNAYRWDQPRGFPMSGEPVGLGQAPLTSTTM
ncbi:hypothetical protein C8Q74DRAFT_1280343 [Fomes fomentarius]|nr:hypothetical protein C8Q74DRAFT_1280343 [Fomes fomentarius]